MVITIYPTALVNNTADVKTTKFEEVPEVTASEKTKINSNYSWPCQ